MKAHQQHEGSNRDQLLRPHRPADPPLAMEDYRDPVSSTAYVSGSTSTCVIKFFLRSRRPRVETRTRRFGYGGVGLRRVEDPAGLPVRDRRDRRVDGHHRRRGRRACAFEVLPGMPVSRAYSICLDRFSLPSACVHMCHASTDEVRGCVVTFNDEGTECFVVRYSDGTRSAV